MLIGFIGGICAGKTTAAKMCADMFNGKVMSLSDGIKEVCLQFDFPFDREHLIKVGEGLRATVSKNVWVQILSRKVAGLLSGGENVFVDDIRYPNELAYLKSVGGTIIGLELDHATAHKRLIERNHLKDTKSFYADFLHSSTQQGSEKFAFNLLHPEGVLHSAKGILNATIDNSGTKVDLRNNLYKTIINYYYAESPLKGFNLPTTKKSDVGLHI